MKNYVIRSVVIILTLLSCPFFYLNAQPSSPEGTWEGKLAVSGVELRIVFHIISEDQQNFKATMDSPDQGAFGIECGAVTFENSSLTILVPNIAGKYEGKFSDNTTIQGTWSQGTANLPLNLVYTEDQEELKRPQEPEPPYPYTVEETKINNDDTGITLSGTLTIPEGNGPFPAVVMVTGSGPQDRDELVFGHKPFLVIADYLTRKGIAVLRYDDRGVGESTGEFSTATSLDFAKDVESAYLFLKDHEKTDPEKTGIIGHSEGGLIAPIVASENDDVGFIVLLAGPGIKGDEILLKQSRLISRASGMSESELDRNEKLLKQVYKLYREEVDLEQRSQKLEKLVEDFVARLSEEERNEPGGSKDAILQRFDPLNTPWFSFFLSYDPATSLQKVKCPVLALNGEMDLQVPSEENLKAIEAALKKGKNKNYRVEELTGLNHLFQPSETGAPTEYGQIEVTFSEEALKIITDWINSLD